MKLRNQLIKKFALDPNLQQKVSLYSNYKEPDQNRNRYVMTDVNDIVICNEEEVNNYLSIGFTVFGSADSNEELDKLVAQAEVS